MQKQYEELITKFIPFVLQSKVEQGFAALKIKLSDKQKQALLKEVQRRLPMCKQQQIDTRHFARLPASEYTVQSNQLFLDSASFRLMENLLDLYQGKMTIGVQEALLDESLYLKSLQSTLENQQAQYYLPVKSFSDPQFKEHIIVPPLKVVISDYCDTPKQIDGLAKEKLCMYSESQSQLRPGSKVKVRFPNFLGSQAEFLTYNYYLESSAEIEEDTWLDTFKLSPDNTEDRTSALSNWLYTVRNAHPRMMLEEMALSTARMRRDSIVHNQSAFILSCQKFGRNYKPTTLFITPQAQRKTPQWREDLQIPGGTQFNAIVEEAIQGAGIYFTGIVEVQEGVSRSVFGTLSDLSNIDQLNNFIHSVNKDSFKIWKCQFTPVEKQDVQQASEFAGADIDSKKLFNNTDALLFVEQLPLGDICSDKPPQPEPLPELFTLENPEPLEIVTGAEADQRKEMRFTMEGQECTLHPSMISSVAGKVMDISASGIKVKINPKDAGKVKDSITLVCKSLGLTKVHYDVIQYHADDSTLRCKMHKSDISEFRTRLTQFFESNKGYFIKRSQVQRRRMLYAAVLDLAGRCYCRPCIFVNSGIETHERLDSLMQPKQGARYTFGDTDSDKKHNLAAVICDHSLSEESAEFDSLLSKNGGQLSRFFRHNPQNAFEAIYPNSIDNNEFCSAEWRESLTNGINKGDTRLTCWHLNAVFCEQSEKYIKNLRLGRLSEVSKDAVFLVMSTIINTSHIIYLNDLSEFHQVLLSHGIYVDV